MKTRIPKQICLLIIATGIWLTGCHRFNEVYPVIRGCKIVKMKGGLNIGDSLVFSYNQKGDPKSIIRGSVGTGAPNHFFGYDGKGRMTDFYGVYEAPNPYFEIWHRYHFDTKNRIITDTTYSFGYIGPGIPIPPPHAEELYVGNVSTYAYDSRNRIIKSTDFYGLATFVTAYYTYNSAGNLEKIVRESNGTSSTETFTYDNKANLRGTHPTWQFLDRDYSVNNSISVQSYNQFGLPVEADFSRHGYNGNFATIPISATTITYDCRYGH
ncbi:hypothetical protein [Chitinophaga caseinilytica]|uniref:hypothetical protein n=1 Tax=Chitinophaga caseinilytica TaxID=2267521 RepID=UPI003C2C8AB8